MKQKSENMSLCAREGAKWENERDSWNCSRENMCVKQKHREHNTHLLALAKRLQSMD